MLKILTLNIGYDGDAHGAWPERRASIAAAIERAGADVVALQAVRHDPSVGEGLDQAAQLARLLPEWPHARFVPAMRRENGASDGSAFLTRHEPGSVDAHRLSLREGLEDINERIVLHARFDFDSEVLHLFNAHFSWVDEQAADNVAEASALATPFDGPAMLVGDLNQHPDGAAMAALRDAGWHDAWELLRPDEPGHTFESSRPDRRIDYVWVNDALRDRIASVDVVTSGGEDRARFSDHLGLVVTLDV